MKIRGKVFAWRQNGQTLLVVYSSTLGSGQRPHHWGFAGLYRKSERWSRNSNESKRSRTATGFDFLSNRLGVSIRKVGDVDFSPIAIRADAGDRLFTRNVNYADGILSI
jgi:hypothetical protein